MLPPWLAIENDSHYSAGMSAETPPPKAPLTPASRTAMAAAAGQRSIDSTSLLGPGGEILIHHQQQVYRLRLTSQGKLILTK